MKTYALFCTLYLITIFAASGKIRNGYARDIPGARESLTSIKLLLQRDKSLSTFQQISMRDKIQNLNHFITYYELTERLLDQFQRISPDLYFEIDSLKDKKGRSIDVYVKFIHEKEMPAGVAGTTNVTQDKSDPDAYTSEYGIHTVSVHISVAKSSLQFLAHEFGHVKHQVPNLASYMVYYAKYYLENSYRRKSFGHNDNDPSGKQAQEYSKKFHDRYLAFLKQGKKPIESHVVLLRDIRTQL